MEEMIHNSKTEHASVDGWNVQSSRARSSIIAVATSPKDFAMTQLLGSL
jgi:hypothetical protein